MVIIESRLTFGQLHFCAKVFTVNASIMTCIRNTLITLSYPCFAAEKNFFCLGLYSLIYTKMLMFVLVVTVDVKILKSVLKPKVVSMYIKYILLFFKVSCFLKDRINYLSENSAFVIYLWQQCYFVVITIF